MYYISKRIEIAFAHQLHLTYESKCQNLHGHNGIVTIYCCAETLDENGMVIDFSHVKRQIKEKMDHQLLNNLLTLTLLLRIWLTGFATRCLNATRSRFKNQRETLHVTLNQDLNRLLFKPCSKFLL